MAKRVPKEPRKAANKSVEADVLVACRRRCCLCVYLRGKTNDRKGQLAHLNGDRSDSRFENLVWLCLKHHNEYDSRSSQAKGLTLDEVRRYRDRLYAETQTILKLNQPFGEGGVELPELDETSVYAAIRERFAEELPDDEPWRYPLWMVANEPSLFAYKASNRADGICLIERIDLPDGRIVIACSDVAGNPGQSTTNSIEALCFQVCERFEIPPERLVWLDHSEFDPFEWTLVEFKRMPPDRPFEDPVWTPMTPELWSELRLAPRKRLEHRRGHIASALLKKFHWPTEGIFDES